jgi:hypothetical protein
MILPSGIAAPDPPRPIVIGVISRITRREGEPNPDDVKLKT